MEDDPYFIDSETLVVEDMRIKSLQLYKCPKTDDNKLDGQVLFIFRLHTLEYPARQPGLLSDPIIRYHTRCTQQSMDSSWLHNLGRQDDDGFLRIVNDITAMADIFLYRETDFQFAYELTRLIRSYYRFSEGMLSATNEDSLVFVVEVMRTYATNELIENMKRMLADSNIKESTEVNYDDDDDEEEGTEEMIIFESDDMGYEVSNVGDDANDCDYKSLVMDFCFDNDTEKEEAELQDKEVEVVVLDNDEEEDEQMEVEVVVLDEEEDEQMDCETSENSAWNEIINEVRKWQGLPNNFEPILEEIKPLITYEQLEWNKIGNGVVISKQEDERGDCAICLTSYSGTVRNHPILTWEQEAGSFRLVRLGCGHMFHHSCIFKWLDKNQTCPLCRSVSYVTV